MQRHDAAGVAFSAYNADTEDYYAFLPSDESMSDVESAPASPIAAKNRDLVEELAVTFASSNSIGSSSKVLTPIGSINGSNGKQEKHTRQKMIQAPAPGVFKLGKGQELKVSPRALELHNARRTQLQDALDAAASDNLSGEAPFRFVVQRKKAVKFVDEKEVEMLGASPAPMVDRMEGHAPEKKNLGRRRPVNDREDTGERRDELVEPDPLYDEQLDDADEQWVQTNLRGTRPETDAMLCCPCCFVTVCMTCERHATYTNQYRATAAINCRVKRDEILTDASSKSSRVSASLPFHKRPNLRLDDGHKAMATTPGQHIADLLQADEFYAVVCSDCGTMVGIFDQDQQYHFFNALPSNC